MASNRQDELSSSFWKGIQDDDDDEYENWLDGDVFHEMTLPEPPKKRIRLELAQGLSEKLPKSTLDLVNEYCEENAAHDIVKLYDHARRFERKHYPTKPEEAEASSNEDENSDGHTWETCDYVEFYWDDAKPGDEGRISDTASTLLRRVDGVHKIHFPNWDWDESPESKSDTSRLLASPTTTTRELPAAELATTIDREKQQLLQAGYTELEDFSILHRKHLPCFTWVISSEQIDEDDKQEQDTIVTSQIGGLAAIYPSEATTDDESNQETNLHVLACQLNLRELPARLQCIVGKRGLWQLFVHIHDGMEDARLRIIPDSDFDKLIRAKESPGPTTNAPPHRKILGWIERPDYPSKHDCPDNWTEEQREQHGASHCHPLKLLQV